MTNKQYIILGVFAGNTKQNKPYIRLKVANFDHKFEISVWDISKEEAPKVGQYVTFATIKENGHYKDAVKKDVQFFVAGKDNPLAILLPTIISNAEWNEVKQVLLNYCTDKILIEIIDEQMDRLLNVYAEFPAATTVHHAYKGGLLNHTYQMLNMLRGIYSVLPFQIKIEHVILGLLFHDFGKIREYVDDGVTKDMALLGHIYIGANELNAILLTKKMNPKEIKHILHCVLAHHGKLEHGSPVIPSTLEAFLVFHLDALSGHGDIYTNATCG
ncbi:MAG: HD domain-containing protein, partial [Bacteroidales bacterium]